MEAISIPVKVQMHWVANIIKEKKMMQETKHLSHTFSYLKNEIHQYLLEIVEKDLPRTHSVKELKVIEEGVKEISSKSFDLLLGPFFEFKMGSSKCC